MKIKYKHAEAPGWYYSFDENGLKSQSWNKKNKPVMYEQMKKWESEGNTIEPQCTAEEQAVKDAKEAADAVESTKSLCIQYLNGSEIHVSNDPPYPENVPEWLDYRGQWRTILRSGIAQSVPDKPF